MAATKDNPIIFYDFVNANGLSWSANLYKTRMSLIYKGLPFRVEGVMAPDIESRMKELGVPPVSNTFPYYTLPAIADPSSDPDGKPTYIVESFEIALYLDKKYPAPQYPAIFGPGTRSIQSLLVTQYFPTISASLGSVVYPNVFRILDPRSIEYAQRTRGNSLDLPSDEVKAQKWKETRENLTALTKSIVLNNGTTEEGPFVMGNQVSFIDFALGGLFHCTQIVEGVDSPRFKELLTWDDGRWGAYWKRLQEIESKSSQVAKDVRVYGAT